MMYSACKLNKQGDNIQPWRTPFPIWKQSVDPCPVLTIVSWCAYRFLKRQVRWSGIPISIRIFQFLVIHTVKGFGIVNKAEIDVFWNSLAFSMIQRMLAIWSLIKEINLVANVSPEYESYNVSVKKLLFFFCIFFKFYFIFKLYITVLVLPNIKMNPPQVYMCSPSWTLLPPPSPFQAKCNNKNFS